MTTQLTLQDEEREILSRILTNYLADLRMEIADTDSRVMRADMHRDEDAIKSMLARISTESPARTGGA